ncbi:MAG: PAS domain-containing sensor histidine kinase [Vicingaceae bacterium]|nr:PAS domain-containing sensor histidine kinase [Vicingaceae bacterium]
MKSNQEIYQLLFENAGEGMVVTNNRGVIELVNPRLLELFGYKQEELIGKRIEILVPDAVKANHSQHREGYVKKPQDRRMGSDMNLLAQRKDKSKFSVEIGLNHCYVNEDLKVVAIVTDITERVEAQQKLKNVNVELEQKVKIRTQELEENQKKIEKTLDKERELNELKSRFVSMASHEFRTPLSTILSSATLVGKYEKEDQKEKREKHLDRIKSSVKNLTSILNDFLSIDKLEDGKISINRTQFLFSELINEAVGEMEYFLKQDQFISVNNSIEVNQLVESDRNVIKNILINLLSNASKYSADGKEIFLSINLIDNNVQIDIKDNGIGIPKEEQAKVFTNRFFRAGNVTNIEGTGLGLTIVKKYLSILGGDISFKSVQYEGTTFSITLPNIII